MAFANTATRPGWSAKLLSFIYNTTILATAVSLVIGFLG